MAQGDWVQAADLRGELKPKVFDVVEELAGKGWRIRRSGHKATLYCPCGDPDGKVPVPGSPKNPDNAAKWIRRRAAHCPDRHPE